MVLNLVVTCSDRKTRPVPRSRMLRSIRGRSIDDRVQRWIEALEDGSEESLSAIDLYAGDHWTVVRSLETVASGRGLDARVWIASAGYGLIPLRGVVRAYSATFATGHPDSVAARGNGGDPTVLAQQWWAALSLWRRRGTAMPRSLRALAAQEPNGALLVAASPAYLLAASADLEAAAGVLQSSDRLAVFSAATASLGALQRFLVPSSARLQTLLGGARQSLNARLLKRALEEASHSSRVTAPALRAWAKELATMQPPAPKYNHTPMSDDEVRSYVTRKLEENPSTKHTALLRQLRDSGRACEQSRFRRLFEEVRGAGHGH
jgi:hypothetical protein